MYATEPPPTSVPKYPSQSQSQPQYTPRTPSSTSAQSSQLPPPSRSDGASTTLSPPPSSGYHPASYGAAALGSVTQSWRVARAELLDNVGGFWPRLRLRIRLFLMGSQRPWRADDVFALFSWIFMGHTLFLLVGTTTFLSLLLGVANSLQFQAYLGKAISDYVTEETGMKVTFESAIVPRWKEGVIRLENVSIICNDQTWTELKNAERRHKGMLPYGPGELDVNWTYWDLTFRHIDVTLSLWRWLDGKGLIKECSLKGVRGEIDRRHVEWPEDWTPIRREPQAGDFEMSRFVVEDLLVTIRNPKFRPYSVSIFTAEMPQLRKQWLLYDLMRADIMNGMFDNCLFSVHKPQRPELVLSDDGDAQPKWGKMSHLKLNGLPIDHLNAGVQGPLGWITRGYLDIDLQLLFPQTENDDFLSIIRDELDGLTDVALDKIEEVISRHPETANRLESPIIRHYRSKHDDNAVETSSMPSNTVTANKEAPAMVMVWNVRLNDIKASVPLVSPHISYINSALIRPIVGYLNAVKTSISISFRAKMDVSNFDGAWTIYQASLTEVLAEEVGRAITQLVAQQRAQHLRRVATWSLQSVTRNLAALVEYARGVRGWREWNEGRLGPMGSGMWTGI
ncbi:mitochondrial distribution and morphology protein family 31/32 [Powellomyces hirtus]|nr:mitochondrial distribution and morphology protein family 31/32 [Powellomyces hirtus]